MTRPTTTPPPNQPPDEPLRHAKLEWLREAIQNGLRSGPATPLDIAEVKRLGRSKLAADS
jgi:hypothetical protein